MESNTTKKNRKINRIRRKMFSAQRHQFAHMLNAQIRPDAFEMVFSENKKRLLEEKLVRKGDVIGIVAGTPMGIRGTTNFMKFHVIGMES